jgi:hypothetical protein
MKNIQVFYKGLSSVSEASTPQLRRLASLTHLDRAQLLSATGNLAWDMWNEPAVAAVS